MSGIALSVSSNYTDNTLPKVYDDEGLNAGSLAMLDFTHSFTQFAGVPANNAAVYNVAWKQAKAILGAGDSGSLAWSCSDSLTSAGEKLTERTTKGALHVVVSQTNQQVNHVYNFKAALAVREYLRLNPTRSFALFLWTNITRISPSTGNLRDFIEAAAAGVASNFLFNGGIPNTLGAARTSVDRTIGWTGTPSTSDAVNSQAIPGWGNVPGYGSLANNVSKSYVLYRAHIVDLGLAGMTFAQADAADLALYNKVFGVGGRLNGDAWAINPTSLP